MTTLNIHQRVAAVMKDLRGVDKGSTNTHFNYKYAGHEAINAAMRPLFLHHGITQTISCSEFRVQQAPTVCSCMVRVRWACTDNPADFIEGDIPALMPASAKSGFTPQMAASLISYGCKGYALKVLMLTDSNEPDAGSWTPEPEPPATSNQHSEAWLQRLRTVGSVKEIAEINDEVKKNWGLVRDLSGFSETYAQARKHAIERVKAGAQ